MAHVARISWGLTIVGALSLLVACAGSSPAEKANPKTPASAVLIVTTTIGPAPTPREGVPIAPCTPTRDAVRSLGWRVGPAELIDGPGGPGTKCAWAAKDRSGAPVTGWVAFIPTAQVGSEYHEQEPMPVIGAAAAFRGSPGARGEILVIGPTGFRLFVTTGDKDAISLASYLVAHA